jgi:S1-C subfamily serine protease
MEVDTNAKDACPPSQEDAQTTGNKWRETLQKVVPCCVVLKVTSTRSFDTESAGSSFATGFIVDRERGLILTNRHVVKPGPITAEAVFLNREELPVYPLYRDPIHDFGFMRFNPKKLRFMEVGEVPLAPQGAQVGIEIRVVGNDSGEKVSILAGTLARLDRDAPSYSSRGFNDFNTFYLQAASGTKGGSSGSPVIDVQGRAIGLNAGSKTKTASAFFLPLDRVVRALEICKTCHSLDEKTDEPCWKPPVIPRGDLQATFLFKGFDEVKRLGLQSETEATVRSHKRQKVDTVGMLVVDSRIPKGPSDGKLEPGDILVEINGATVTHFLDMEDILDQHVDGEVSVSVVRGGQTITYQIRVENLHRVTPDSFLEVSGGSIHALSYQQARNFSTHTGQVYVSDPGYMLSRAGIPKHSVILSVKNEETPDVQTLAKVISTIKKGSQVPVHYRVFSDRFRKRQALIYVDQKWYGPLKGWQRDDAEGSWVSMKTLSECCADKPTSMEGTEEKGEEAKKKDSSSSPKTAPNGVNGQNLPEDPKEAIARSLVLVDVEVPEVALADGVHSKSFTGNGVIVHQDSKIGLVLVDRNTVAIGPCDIRLSFYAYPAELHGTVRFLHPLYNFALVSYNPAELSMDAVKLVKPCTILAEPPLSRGSKVILVGLSGALRPTARDASVTNATAALNIPTAEIPRFHAVNEEVIELDQDFGTSFSGVLIDKSASVRALWGSFARQVGGEEREFCAGIHSYTFASWINRTIEFLKKLEDSPDLMPTNSVPVPVMNVEFNALLLSKAANYGLSKEWIKKLTEYDGERKQVLKVKSCLTSSNAKAILNEGDMVLSINDKLVSSFYDVMKTIESHCKDYNQLSFSGLQNAKEMKLTVFKANQIREVSFKLEVTDGLGTDRLIHWAGAQIQDSYRAVRERGFLPKNNGVYISRWHHGSPSHRYGMYALHWILEVNGKPTPDIDTFLKETSDLPHQSFVRVKMCHLDNKPKVITLRQDLRFWPTWELKLNHRTGEWKRSVIKSIV